MTSVLGSPVLTLTKPQLVDDSPDSESMSESATALEDSQAQDLPANPYSGEATEFDGSTSFCL
jgi:hypothetical protein